MGIGFTRTGWARVTCPRFSRLSGGCLRFGFPAEGLLLAACVAVLLTASGLHVSDDLAYVDGLWVCVAAAA